MKLIAKCGEKDKFSIFWTKTGEAANPKLFA